MMTSKEAMENLDVMLLTIECDHNNPPAEFYEAVSMAKSALTYRDIAEKKTGGGNES